MGGMFPQPMPNKGRDKVGQQRNEGQNVFTAYDGRGKVIERMHDGRMFP